MAEGNGLLNRRTGNTVPGVQIPLSPPLLWTLFCLTSVVGLSLFWGEGLLGLTAAVTGILYTILAGWGRCSCFVFGLINAPLYAYLSYCHGYYGDFALNLYYFVMMFPGWWAWSRHQSADKEKGIERVRLSARARVWGLVSCVVSVLGLWVLLRYLGGTRPLCDALTNILSIAAMVLTVRRAIEQWYLWIAVDIVEVIMWFAVWRAGGGMVSVLLMWLLFLANGIYLLHLWRKAEQTKKPPHPEG